MEVMILKSTSADFLVEEINRYLSTGWDMDGNVVVVSLEDMPDKHGIFETAVLYTQKMVRERINRDRQQKAFWTLCALITGSLGAGLYYLLMR